MAKRTLPPNFHSHEHGNEDGPMPWVMVPPYMSLPLLRGPLGYELVRPWVALWRTVVLFFLPVVFEAVFSGFATRPALPYFTAYLLLCFAATLFLYGRRWIGSRRNERIHTREAGYSWLAWHTSLPVPLCEILIVPAAVFLIGYVLKSTLSAELGIWLMFTGLSLFGMGFWEYRRIWSQQRATTDDMLRSGAFEARMDRHDAGPKAQAQKPKEDADFADLA